MTRRFQRVAVAFAVLMAGDCIEGPTGPGSQEAARVRLEVILPPGTPDAWLPAGDTLRVLVRRAGRVEPIVDTAGVTDSLSATVTVPLDQAIERFVATAELVYRGQVMFLAFDAVQLRAALDTTVVLTAVYVGPGGRAASLTVAAADSALAAGDTTTVVPTALDTAGQFLGRVPARFLSDRPDLFTVDTDGHVTALDGAPDTARVDVVMPTGLTASLPLWLIEVLQPVTGQVVAFISTRDGNREVYAMLEDGSGAVRLTESPEDEFFPAWSPDGSAIAFEREVDGARQILVVTLADRAVTPLTTQGTNTGPRFSPDGSRIGFTSTRNGGPEVWVMDANGGNQRRLIDPAGEVDAFADWSPDGREILYVRRATPGSSSVGWIADTSGSAGRILIEAGEGWTPNILAARWSPRGGLVAYTHADADTIVLVRGLDQTGAPDVGATGSAFDAHAAFARGDDRFVFESDAGGAHAIYSQDAAGTVSRLSPPGIAEFEPDFVPPRPAIYVDRVIVSPDSVGLTSDESSRTYTASAIDAGGQPVAAPVQWIAPSGAIAQLLTGPPVEIVALGVGKTWAIASYRGWRTDSAPITITPATGPNAQRLVFRIGADIYTMRGDGTDTVRLTTPAIGGYDPAFSPDGARVAWANRAGGDGDLWVMNADGSSPAAVTSGPADDIQPSWSPDGQQVVFSANRVGATPNQRQIWIVRLDGTGLRQLTFPPAANLQDVDPAWSPDGSAVVFSRFVLGVGTSSLRTVDVTGGTDRALVMPAGSYRFPSWTPDGTAIVYTRLSVGTFIQYLGVGRLPYPTGTETLISTGTTPRGFGSGGHLVPSVASDGLIAFSSGLGVTVMRADGTGLSGLVPGGVPGNWHLATPPRYVAALNIGGDVATPIAVAGTRQLSAGATDQGGLPIAPVGGFQWTSLDPGVAAVDGAGLVTGEAPGSARIVAASGLAAPDTVTVTIGAVVASMTRTWVGGDPAGPTDWHLAGNWNPAAVPGAADTAIIESAANQPALTASATVARLRILGGNLTLNGRTLTVTGDFSTENGLGTITMQQPNDSLVIGGHALFQGGSTFGLLTDGVLLVAGDFGQLNAGDNWDTFRTTDANHRTVLNGSALQRMGIQGNLTFDHLEIANTGDGVEPVFGTVIDVQGDFSMTTPTVLFAPDHGLDVEGTVSTVAGSELVAAQMRLGGALAVAGTFDVDVTEFSGFDQEIPDLPYREVVVSDSAYLGASVTMTALFITGNSSGTSLTVNGHALTVTQLTTGGGGADPAVLIMQHPADVVIVTGNATFGGGNTEGLLTAGVLFLGGHFFHQQPSAFRATGNHRTVLNGAALQQLWINQDQARFHHLEVANGGLGVEIPLVGEGAGFEIGGKLVITVPVPFIGEDATVSVGDSLVTVAGSEITLWGLMLRGGLSVAGGLSARQVEFAGAGQVIPAQGIFNEVTVTGTARLAGPMSFPGFVGVRENQANLVLDGHRLDVGTLSIGGFGTGGAVTMTNAADSLVVSADAIFAGGNSAGLLTAGTLIVNGLFFQGVNPAAFQPSGTHRTVLTGTGAVRFEHPGVAGSTSWFHDLVITATASPLFQLSAGVTANLELIGIMTVQTAAVTVDVVGNLLLRAGSTLNNSGTVQYGTFTNEGATINGNAPVQRP